MPSSFTARYMFFLSLLCVSASALFAKGLNLDSIWLQNLSGFFFTVCLVVIGILNFKYFSHFKNHLEIVLLQVFLLSLSLYIFFQVFGIPESSFWVGDSVSTHLPTSLRYKQLISESFSWKAIMGIDTPGRSTHMITGIMILLMGKNVVATGMAQLLFKLITCYCLYTFSHIQGGRRTAFLALLIYAFCPTVFFYTNVLYKESAVQSLVAIALLSLARIVREKKKLYFLLYFLSLALLVNERFYVALLIFFGSLGYIISSIFRSEKKGLLFFLFITIVSTVAIYLVWREYVLGYLSIIKQQRYAHASFGDVLNKYNYEIPYFVALIKITFSPYFTFNKFNMFIGFSNLLIWGAVVNQGIIFFAVLGLKKALRISLSHIYLALPLLVYLLFAAYISPWNGRARDSFYPIIAFYAAFFLDKYNILNSKQEE